MDFIERAVGLIVSPGRAMADIAKEPRWEEALLIVGVYAVILVVSTHQTFSHIAVTYGDGTSSAPPAMMALNIVFLLLLPVVLWTATSAVTFLIARVAGGKGGFAGTIAGIGYSELVKIFGVVIGIALLTQAPMVTVARGQTGLSISTPMLMAYGGDPFAAAAQIVGLLCLLWSCGLGVLALKHSQAISTLKAAAIIGVPLAVYVIFLLMPLYRGFM